MHIHKHVQGLGENVVEDVRAVGIGHVVHADRNQAETIENVEAAPRHRQVDVIPIDVKVVQVPCSMVGVQHSGAGWRGDIDFLKPPLDTRPISRVAAYVGPVSNYVDHVGGSRTCG